MALALWDADIESFADFVASTPQRLQHPLMRSCAVESPSSSSRSALWLM